MIGPRHLRRLHLALTLALLARATPGLAATLPLTFAGPEGLAYVLHDHSAARQAPRVRALQDRYLPPTGQPRPADPTTKEDPP